MPPQQPLEFASQNPEVHDRALPRENVSKPFPCLCTASPSVYLLAIPFVIITGGIVSFLIIQASAKQLLQKNGCFVLVQDCCPYSADAELCLMTVAKFLHKRVLCFV